MRAEFSDGGANGTAAGVTEAVAPAAPRHGRASVAPKRRFLFVSAPFGPFARELAVELRRRGADVTRVILNAGDALDWGVRDARPYFGASADWADWLEHSVHDGDISDIVVYGDCSPHAAMALERAQALGVRAHVLEQGYFRPDWITLERGGVNANSPLPRDPAWFRERARTAPAQAIQVVGRTTPSAVVRIVAYHTALYLGAPLFRRYRAPYSEPAIKQGLGHAVRFARSHLSRERDRRSYDDMLDSGGRTFLLALQRPGDSQLWRHSDFRSVPELVDHVVASFAAGAPEDARLIVRPHPLDPGLVPHARIVADAARRCGVGRRVRLVEYGKLHDLLPHVAGVVCVNSTAGLAAIEFGRPTITLGRAIYDMPGMTHQGELDGFWREPAAPDPSLYTAFRRAVMAHTQVNGAYATARGRRLAVRETAERLLNGARPASDGPE